MSFLGYIVSSLSSQGIEVDDDGKGGREIGRQDDVDAGTLDPGK